MSESIEQQAASGGRVWQPPKKEVLKPQSKSLFLVKTFASYLIYMSWAALALMVIHGYIYSINFPAQKDDVFAKIALYEEKWEFMTIVAIFALLTISLYLWSFDLLVTFIVAAFTLVAFVIVVIPVLVFQPLTSMSSTEWLKDKQQLSFVNNIDIPMEQLTNNKTILMQGDDKKIYSVTFKNVNHQLSITKKVTN